jgi:hypothetical protein
MYPRLFACALAASALGLSACSDRSRRSTAPASTAAPATSGGATGPTTAAGPQTPLFSFNNPTPATAARQQQALLLFNDELQELWDQLRPGLQQRLTSELQVFAQGGKLSYAAGPVTVGVTQVRNVTLNAPVAPGFVNYDYQRLHVAVPRQGPTWKISAEIEVGLGAQLGPLQPNLAIPVRLDIEFAAEIDARLDDSDPARPVVTGATFPQSTLNVALSSSVSGVQTLLAPLTTFARTLTQNLTGIALNALLAPSAGGYPGPVWARAAQPLADSGTPTPFEEVAVNVDRRIRRDSMPFGTIHRTVMDTPVDDESWLDAYVNGGPGSAGQVVRHFGESDSAINTAYFLAAQAFRYRARGQESEAFDNLAITLAGVSNLIDVNRGSGLLARSAAPSSSPLGQHIIGRGEWTRTQLHGQEWVGWQSHNGISRDQYTGIFYGLAIVHELVADPHVKGECARLITAMLDYLIRRDWILIEDRPNWTQASAGKAFPAPVRVQAIYQQLTWLTIGERVAPGRFTAELQRLDPLAPITWIGPWSGVSHVESYYRFNLQMLNAYNYFLLETDPQRWMEMARGYRITQRWIGHHQNPHFDMIQTALDPSLGATLHPGVREGLRGFLRRNHRAVAPPGLDFSQIQWQPFTFPSLLSLGQAKPQQVPTAPLPVPLRYYTGYFQWQKQPTRTADRPTDPQKLRRAALEEKPGTDLVMPYWMGRWYGAF